MQSWLPVPGTTSGRLVEAALELFGSHGFGPVGVTAIAARAGVTTGSLYHHFGSKAELYRLVRADVERRVLDRLEGAASMHPVTEVADFAAVLGVGFDYLVNAGYTRLLAEPVSVAAAETQPAQDDLELAFDRLLLDEATPLGFLVAAAWRSALWRAGDGEAAAAAARAALVRLLAG
jgi:AcrR family transcriptional regulator